MSGQRDDRPLILVTLGGGGWHREMYQILERYSPDEFRFAYVYGYHSGNHSAGRLPMPHDGERYAVHYLGPTRKHRWRFITNSARFALSCLENFRLVWRLRPAAILALGHPAAIPLFVAAKVFRARCVFVESLTRVVRLSVVGQIVYHLHLAKQVYVQWPGLRQRYPRARFAGAVL
jgi:beta-1,4-N-acetylglucosaminyltransferase